MKHIRPAAKKDLARIAEIEIFNYRLQFYPIFRDDRFYFGTLQVPALMEQYCPLTNTFWVYDDGAVKGFVQVLNGEIKKLFVEPILQGHSIGSELLEYAVRELNGRRLWALEKNTRAIAFYQRHGFHLTTERKPEEDTTECLIRMELGADREGDHG